MDSSITACEIWIDKEGVWFYRGAEMFRRDIVRLFYKHLTKDFSGRYMIEMDNERCYVGVEDKAFVVKAVYCFASDKESEEVFYLLLSDGDLEELDMETFRIGEDNIPYCWVKNRKFEARFSKPSYYQITQFIQYDPDRDAYFIAMNGKRHYFEYKEDREA